MSSLLALLLKSESNIKNRDWETLCAFPCLECKLFCILQLLNDPAQCVYLIIARKMHRNWISESYQCLFYDIDINLYLQLTVVTLFFKRNKLSTSHYMYLLKLMVDKTPQVLNLISHDDYSCIFTNREVVTYLVENKCDILFKSPYKNDFRLLEISFKTSPGDYYWSSSELQSNIYLAMAAGTSYESITKSMTRYVPTWKLEFDNSLLAANELIYCKLLSYTSKNEENCLFKLTPTAIKRVCQFIVPNSEIKAFLASF